MLNTMYPNAIGNPFTTPWSGLPFGGVSPFAGVNPINQICNPFTGCTPYGVLNTPYNCSPFNCPPFNCSPWSGVPYNCPPVGQTFGQGFGFGGYGGFGVPFSTPVHQGVLPYNQAWGQNLPFGCNVPCPVPGVNALGLGQSPFGVGSLPYSPINAINPFTSLNPVNCGPLGCPPFSCPPFNCPPYNCLPINGLPYSMINPVTGFSPVNPISNLPYVNPIAGLTHPGVVGQTSSIFGGLPFPTNQFSPSVPFAGVNPFVNPILSTLNCFGASTNFNTPWSNYANTSPLNCFGSVPFGGLGVNPYLTTPHINPLMVNPYLQGLGLWPSTQIPGLHAQGIQGQVIKTHNGVITPNGVSTTVPFPGAYVPGSAFPFPVAPFHTPIHGGLTGYSPAYTPAVAGVGCEIA